LPPSDRFVSGGKGLFLMAEKQTSGKDVRGQLLAKVG